MKKYLFAAFLFGSAFLGYGQMVLSSGSQIIVNSGSVVVANNITSSGGTIKNLGEVSVLGHITNNSGILFDNASTGTVTFEGSAAQEIKGSASITFKGTVDIDNSNGVSLNSVDETIDGTLNFTNGLLTLGAYDLTIVGSTNPTGAAAGQYVQTNSTGVVKRSVPNDATDVLFPVGNGAYNPITLQNSATSTTDTYSVKVVDDDPSTTATEHMVDRSWVVTEDNSGSSDLTVTAQWNSGEELTSFDRTNSSVGLTTDNGTTYTWGATGAATGSDPYTHSGTGFTGVGTFVMGDSYFSGKVFDLKLMLAGAYNGSTMDKDLNTGSPNLIPLTDPYGLSTTVTTVPTDAVDWVKIELRDNGNHATVLHSFARFVDVNGQVIEEDGTNFKITGVTLDDYFVAVLHRNHFGVVSTETIDLDVASPVYDFSSFLVQAWDDTGITTNDAMKNVSGVFCLWEGDANDDGEVQYEGSNPDRVTVLNAVGTSTPTNKITSTYSAIDVNMDGEIQYEGSNPDRVTILNVIGTATPTIAYSVHLP